MELSKPWTYLAIFPEYWRPFLVVQIAATHTETTNRSISRRKGNTPLQGNEKGLPTISLISESISSQGRQQSRTEGRDSRWPKTRWAHKKNADYAGLALMPGCAHVTTDAWYEENPREAAITP
jgi:hypothetical protein